MKDSYPVSAQRLEKHFYVNNLVAEAHTAEEAQRFYDETNTILAAAGMKMRKWMTNLPDLPKHMNHVHPEMSSSTKC